MVHRPGELQGFFAAADGFRELAQLRETPRQARPGVHGWQLRHPEPLEGQVAVERLHVQSEEADGVRVVGLGIGKLTEPRPCGHLQGDVFVRVGDLQRAAAGLHGPIAVTHEPPSNR